MIEPIHIISLGAGVQSSTMALMAKHGEITPMPKCAIFADTQDEPKSVYTWLDWLEKQLPFPVHRVTKGSLSADVKLMHRTKDGRLFSRTDIPFFTRNHDGGEGKIRFRSCTKNFKILPIRKLQRKLGNIQRGQKTIGVICWIGISLDEVHRMKHSRDPWIENRYPLIENRINRHSCVEWMESHGYPKPPRSACVYCPYHSDHEWRRLRREEPIEFQKAVDFEKNVQASKAQSHNFKTVQYLHRQLVPLDKVDFSTDEDHGQQVMFGNECEGMCGV